MRVNEVQRWRIVDENITKTANFEIGFVNLFRFAGRDGS